MSLKSELASCTAHTVYNMPSTCHSGTTIGGYYDILVATGHKLRRKQHNYATQRTPEVHKAWQTMLAAHAAASELTGISMLHQQTLLSIQYKLLTTTARKGTSQSCFVYMLAKVQAALNTVHSVSFLDALRSLLSLAVPTEVGDHYRQPEPCISTACASQDCRQR